jgi:hypothetical protein
LSLQEDHWGQPLAHDLNELVNSSQFSDIAFEVGGERIVAHKAILVSRSQYFQAMFTNSLRETYSGRDETIVIEGVSAVGFLAMIRYLYTGTIDTSVKPLTLVELIRGLFVKFGLISNFLQCDLEQVTLLRLVYLLIHFILCNACHARFSCRPFQLEGFTSAQCALS